MTAVIRWSSRNSALAEAELGVPPQQRPGHIAIIMDGNGRWAQQQGLPRIEGHRHGVATVRAVTEECARLGIGRLTLYCLSSENWKRPRVELDFLMRLLRQYVIEERQTLLRNKIRLSIIGRREEIAPDVLDEIDKTIALSAPCTGLELCLAINYGGRTELVDAIRTIAAQVRAGTINPTQIDEDLVAGHLYTAGYSDPDLLIRTAGEMRLSNFLLWQVSYSEIWVTPRCWPEFREADLHQAIRDFASRERRFGGLNE